MVLTKLGKGASVLTTVAGIALIPFKFKTGIAVTIAGLAMFASNWMYTQYSKRKEAQKDTEEPYAFLFNKEPEKAQGCSIC